MSYGLVVRNRVVVGFGLCDSIQYDNMYLVGNDSSDPLGQALTKRFAAMLLQGNAACYIAQPWELVCVRVMRMQYARIRCHDQEGPEGDNAIIAAMSGDWIHAAWDQ